MRRLIALFFILLLSVSVTAVIEKDSIKLFAVTNTGNALSADLTLEIRPGSGKIWSSVEPLVGTSTQTTEKFAVQIAERYAENTDNYDYFFGIKSEASLVEGPSAGAAMTLLTISMLNDRYLPDHVALTGTITPDGSVGTVGSIFEKSKEAAKLGVRLFMIPFGEARQTVRLPEGVKSINLPSYAEEQWGLKVVEVRNIDEVLSYAFTDLSQIDVNANDDDLPDFVPEPISFNENVRPMHDLVGNYLNQADQGVSAARNSLSGTLLEDPAVIDLLLGYLSSSEKMLQNARISFDQNYLYSAGNYAFLSTVYSGFVKDIAANPELLSPASSLFDSKLSELKVKIDSLGFDLNRFVSVDQFEWHIAAKQRLTWAKLKVDKLLSSSKEIVITINGSSIDETKLVNLLDYQFAVAWHQAAGDFFNLTKGSRRRILADPHFLNEVNSKIASAESTFNILERSEHEDIVRRIDASELAKEKDWYYSALFDSASALSLANAQIFVKNKDLDALRSALQERIDILESKMNESKHNFVWAHLYLDHAKYFLSSSDFYLASGQTDKATEDAISGISLVFLAESGFESALSSYNYFDSLPDSRFLQISPFEQLPLVPLYSFLLLFVVLVAIVALIPIFNVLAKKMHWFIPVSLESEIKKIMAEQRSLKRQFDAGQLPEPKYKEMNTVYQKQLDELLGERSDLSRGYVELDISTSKLFAFERAVKRMKKQYKKGKITKRDFKEAMQLSSRRIDSLKKEVEREVQQLQSEKQSIKKSVSSAEEQSRTRKARRKGKNPAKKKGKNIK